VKAEAGWNHRFAKDTSLQNCLCVRVMSYLIQHFLETVIGSAVHWLFATKKLHLVLVLLGFGCHCG